MTGTLGHSHEQIGFTSYGSHTSFTDSSFYPHNSPRWSHHDLKGEEVEVWRSEFSHPEWCAWWVAGPALDTRFCDSEWPAFPSIDCVSGGTGSLQL